MPAGYALRYPKWEDGGSFAGAVEGAVIVEERALQTGNLATSGGANLIAEMLSKSEVARLSLKKPLPPMDYVQAEHFLLKPYSPADPLYVSVGRPELAGLLIGTWQRLDVLMVPFVQEFNQTMPTLIFTCPLTRTAKDPAIKKLRMPLKVLGIDEPSTDGLLAAMAVCKLLEAAVIKPAAVSRQVRRAAVRRGHKLTGQIEVSTSTQEKAR